MRRDTKRVRLTWPWEAPNGTKYEKGSEATVDVATANMLVKGGRAVLVTEKPTNKKRGE